MRVSIFIVSAVLLSLATAVQAQNNMKHETVIGSGIIKSEKRDVPKFGALTLDGSADVDITIGDKTEVVVETDDNILPYIETEVKDNKLEITTKPHVTLNYKKLKVSITTPSLSEVKVNGSGDIAVGELSNESFQTTINGSGSVTAKGQAQEVQAEVRGSGDLVLVDLTTQRAKIRILGSGSAKVNALKSLQAFVAGSGRIQYKNNSGVDIDKHVGGSGSINPL